VFVEDCVEVSAVGRGYGESRSYCFEGFDEFGTAGAFDPVEHAARMAQGFGGSADGVESGFVV
jgi:hypothetical protein